MLEPATVATFLVRPVGSYVAGPGYVVWCAGPAICGSSHWGELGDRAWGDLKRLFDVATSPGLRPPIKILMDCRALERIDGEVFDELGPYVRSRLPAWGPRIAHQAVLLPQGALGYALAGVLPALGADVRVEFFERDADALDALGLRDTRVWTEARQVVQACRGEDADLLRLRRYLGDRLRDATVGGAAVVLGMASRSLQRALRAQGTTFSAELSAARIRAASKLLRDSDLKLEVVARRVGCSSSSHLARLLRRALGETPAAYRARHRG